MYYRSKYTILKLVEDTQEKIFVTLTQADFLDMTQKHECLKKNLVDRTSS